MMPTLGYDYTDGKTTVAILLPVLGFNNYDGQWYWAWLGSWYLLSCEPPASN